MRLAKWFTTMSPKAKSKITKDVTQLVLARRVRDVARRKRGAEVGVVVGRRA